MPSPHHPENFVQIAPNSIDPITIDPAIAVTLSELCKTLTELQPLASRIADLQNETLEKEASILKAILEKLTPLVPVLSEDCDPLGKGCEQCYRRGIAILTSEERVQLEGSSFFNEHRLILYENSLLVRTHHYGQFMNHGQSVDNGHSMGHGQSTEALHFGWENTDEDVLTPDVAIIIFGFTAISKGLMTVLGEASSMIALKEELEGDLMALAGALEALQ